MFKLASERWKWNGLVLVGNSVIFCREYSLYYENHVLDCVVYHSTSLTPDELINVLLRCVGISVDLELNNDAKLSGPHRFDIGGLKQQ